MIDAEHVQTSVRMLDALLAARGTVEFHSANADVSVILVLLNNAELTLRCLRSLERQQIPLHVIAVDNGSSDRTSQLLARCTGVDVIRNETNRGFPTAVNQAAQRAHSPYLLVLNNDTELHPDSIAAGLHSLTASDDIGAVGGKIILTNGRLQEAGSIVWNDGSTCGYGRGDAPFAPSYMFRRDVDYCSAVFLLTRRDLFLQTGGFDERYSPAYYEDADYCLRLWKNGYRVVYEPAAIVRHFEFASSPSMDDAVRLQTDHRSLFTSEHADVLDDRLPPAAGTLAGRTAHRAGLRILVIDDRVPHPSLGAGYPRAKAMIAALQRLGHFVTFYPMTVESEPFAEVYRELPRTVEAMVGFGIPRLADFLHERRGYYDRIIVSRPWNMRIVAANLHDDPDLLGHATLLYDAEAIMSEREIALRRSQGESITDDALARALDDEFAIARDADAVIAVSNAERERFLRAGCDPVFLLGHPVSAAPTPVPFDERHGILFVGAIHEEAGPNADALAWFAFEVLPLIREQLGFDVPVIVGGLNKSERIAALDGNGIQLLGRIDDLDGVYSRARIFIAPTRYAAGIPLKLVDAAAHGIPIVCTSIVASQLGWQDRTDVLVADDAVAFAQRCVESYTDAGLWASLRCAALRRITADCSHETFDATIEQVLRHPGRSERRVWPTAPILQGDGLGELELRTALIASRHEIDDLGALQLELRMALGAARREADDLRRSMSWRMTGPLRRIYSGVRWLRGLQP